MGGVVVISQLRESGGIGVRLDDVRLYLVRTGFGVIWIVGRTGSLTLLVWTAGGLIRSERRRNTFSFLVQMSPNPAQEIANRHSGVYSTPLRSAPAWLRGVWESKNSRDGGHLDKICPSRRLSPSRCPSQAGASVRSVLLTLTSLPPGHNPNGCRSKPRSFSRL